MTHWPAIIVATMLASFPTLARAQNCEALPAGPARTDCYIGLSRIHQGQSNIAAGTAAVKSDAARYRQVTGKNVKPRRKKAATGRTAVAVT